MRAAGDSMSESVSTRGPSCSDAVLAPVCCGEVELEVAVFGAACPSASSDVVGADVDSDVGAVDSFVADSLVVDGWLDVPSGASAVCEPVVEGFEVVDGFEVVVPVLDPDVVLGFAPCVPVAEEPVWLVELVGLSLAGLSLGDEVLLADDSLLVEDGLVVVDDVPVAGCEGLVVGADELDDDVADSPTVTVYVFTSVLPAAASPQYVVFTVMVYVPGLT